MSRVLRRSPAHAGGLWDLPHRRPLRPERRDAPTTLVAHFTPRLAAEPLVALVAGGRTNGPHSAQSP